jgi:hypothetical protein
LIRDIPVDNSQGVTASDGSMRCTASTAVHDAYWYASRLINVGWTIRRIGTTEQGGFFVAETPRQQVVVVDERAVPRNSLAAQFATSLSALASASDAEGRDYLCDLVQLILNNVRLRRPMTLLRCTCDIPDLPAHLQPNTEIRAAYWFAVTLTDDYGWKLFEIGKDTAAGGFIADIPGEALAVYPASMPDDRTAASALARLVGSMNANDVVGVATLVELHDGAGEGYRQGWSY